jgi:hypothetical protein
MATDIPETEVGVEPEETQPLRIPEVIIYGHSTLFYWWPLWVFGYLFAFICFVGGIPVAIEGAAKPVLFYGDQTLGVAYSLILFAVIVITNMTFRGLSSFTFILGVAFLSVVVAYFGWWDDIAVWIPHLAVFMNMGFYVFFSTLLFAAWAFGFFIYDRLTYRRVRPGQVTQE